MKNFIYLSLFCTFLLLSSQSIFGQTVYHGKNGIAGDLQPFLGKLSTTPSPLNDGEYSMFEKGKGAYGGVTLDLPALLDLSGSKVFKVTAMVKSPKGPLKNNTLLLAVRNEANDGMTQLAQIQKVTKYDEWVTYSFDVSGKPLKTDYSKLVLIMSPKDEEGEAVGVQVFLKEISGPGITSENVLLNAKTNLEGNQVILDVVTKDDLDTKTKKPVFKVIKNGYKNVAIENVTVEAKRIVIDLEKPFKRSEDVKVSYTKGKITDVTGKEIKYFKNQVVKNEVELKLLNYTDFGGNNTHINGLAAYGGDFSEGVADPLDANAKVGTFTKGSEVWSAIRFKLNQEIDPKINTVFKVKVYCKNPGKEVTNNKIFLTLQVDNTVKNQLVQSTNIKVFDQWVEYEFDFTGMSPKEATFNSASIMLGSPDKDSDAVGVVYYIKDLKGGEFIMN
ncbi:SwmB domain-containing protein [Flammeovirga aprica]|uniref:CBM-cenC domain-containing protein n=1 Tax=Flammeovirga aprica JL-4 TaxID=694437 RepID=A0A7X9P4B0_9BACT|nr:SwmB domain-containing protein [Flammeovirga aprica]NME68727.1 hypothetical protein [Flammeovirga aprica JL-4]